LFSNSIQKMVNKDVIVVGLQPWDIEMGSNCKNIAMELSRKNRVLYVNRALDRASLITKRKDKKVQQRIKSIKGQIPDLTKEMDNLWVLNPRTILESVNKAPSFLFRYFNKINNKRLARAIFSAMERLKFNPDILFIDNDFFRAYYLPELLNPEFSIYYIRDYLTDQPYFKKFGPEMEISLIRKVNLVAANSPYLAKYASKANENAYDIGQGCDFSLLSKNSDSGIPEDMKTIPEPVIGYMGALNSQRLDIDLIQQIAALRPDWSIVLVGNEDKAFANSQLHIMNNVYFLGFKEQEKLADYIRNFDVCINPQKVNSLTIGNYPRKVDEYLFMERPVVATYTEFMEKFKGYVYLCNSAEEYVSAITKAISDSQNNQRVDDRKFFALSHSWENSVGELSKLYLQTKSKMNG
jgi:teichuronic acid biosynthesis glycosyltransferase TuaH